MNLSFNGYRKKNYLLGLLQAVIIYLSSPDLQLQLSSYIILVHDNNWENLLTNKFQPLYSEWSIFRMIEAETIDNILWRVLKQ